MDHEITSLVRQAQDDVLARRERERAPLEHRLAALHATRRSRGRGRVYAAIAAVSVAAGIVLLLRARGPQTPPPLAFTVDGRGGFLFSEGSEVKPATAAVVHVTDVTDHGAAIVLEHGSVHTHVVPRAGNRWRIEAGPYRVEVKGTRFDTTWSPATGTLRVAMHEGRVLVTGDCLGSGRALSAGEVTEIKCPTPASAPVAPEPAPAVPLVAASPARELHAAPREIAAPSSPPSRSAPASVRSASTLSEAIAAPAAPAPAPAPASAEQIMRVADDARRRGEHDVAERAYRDVRARFANSPEAAAATFLLARMLASGSRTDEAEGVFAEYTRQAPGGVFSEEAWGRLLELARNRGDAVTARERARVYLDRFPRGASAEVAAATLRRP